VGPVGLAGQVEDEDTEEELLGWSRDMLYIEPDRNHQSLGVSVNCRRRTGRNEQQPATSGSRDIWLFTSQKIHFLACSVELDRPLFACVGTKGSHICAAVWRHSSEMGYLSHGSQHRQPSVPRDRPNRSSGRALDDEYWAQVQLAGSV
jgi:hypothetical protein